MLSLRRSKFNKINLKFLINYFLKTLNFINQNKLLVNRNVIISPLYDTKIAYTHQGRVFVKILLNPNKTGFKFGMFAATKKPFNFRPKKQKKKR